MNNLINLLAATQSLLGTHSPSGRFKMRQDCLLPKFNQDRPDPCEVSRTGTTSSLGGANRMATTVRPEGCEPMEPGSSLHAGQTSTHSTTTTSEMTNFSSMTLRRFFSGAKADTRKSTARLEQVRVLRNDLVDADLVVTRGGEELPEERPFTARASEMEGRLARAGRRLLEKIGM